MSTLLGDAIAALLIVGMVWVGIVLMKPAIAQKPRGEGKGDDQVCR